MGQEHLIPILEEQVSVGFTGRVNVLASHNKQMLGSVLILDGDIIDCTYKESKSLKAFYNLCIDEFENFGLSYIVEPELIESNKKSIHFPFSVLKRKIVSVIEEFRKSKANKPPGDLKILLKPECLDSDEIITEDEFSLMTTITDYNRVDDIYKNSTLLDFEITNALVSLRKKQALKVVKSKE